MKKITLTLSFLFLLVLLGCGDKVADALGAASSSSQGDSLSSSFEMQSSSAMNSSSDQAQSSVVTNSSVTQSSSGAVSSSGTQSSSGAVSSSGAQSSSAAVSSSVTQSSSGAVSSSGALSSSSTQSSSSANALLPLFIGVWDFTVDMIFAGSGAVLWTQGNSYTITIATDGSVEASTDAVAVTLSASGNELSLTDETSPGAGDPSFMLYIKTPNGEDLTTVSFTAKGSGMITTGDGATVFTSNHIKR